jgi:protein-S-isoprenylcysteine O-methyltransferase Ste14
MSAMRATQFEFEQRFWIIGALFFLGFSFYWLDPVNAAVAILHFFRPSLDAATAAGNFWVRIIFGGGALLVFIAAGLRTWATAYLRTEIVHDAGQHTEELVADGPFRYVRNPLYLANLPMAAGIGVLASRIGWFILVVGMWLFVYRLILREEDGLLLHQNESYRAYLRSVPRLWPSLRPRIPSAGRLPRWGQAFAGEIFVWLFGAAVLCFAITLNPKLTSIVFALSLVIYFMAIYLLTKGTPPSGPKA